MADEMQWNSLIRPVRFRGPLAEPTPDGRPDMVRGPYQKDFDRIIYSSAFRRLQDKTQVHPFPGTDYVRTRLTHSLEVSSVGRSLGVAIGKHAQKIHRDRHGGKEWDLAPSDFGDVTATACLSHDIGNPPFGHAGEDAIQHWFRTDGREFLPTEISPQESADLKHFDGNAQGFRVLSRLQGWREGGLQLSCSTLAAFTKYPYGSTKLENKGSASERNSPPASECDTQDYSTRKKFGYFSADRESFARVVDAVQLLQVGADHGVWCRHPLAILVEAADDICYHIVDLEDGFKYKKISFEDAEKLLASIAPGDMTRYDKLATESDKIAYLRGWAIGALVKQVANAFYDNYNDIMRGTFTEPIIKSIGKDAPVMEEIRSLCSTKLYYDADKMEADVAGFEVIKGLLRLFCESVTEWEYKDGELARMHPRARRVVQLIPNFKELPRERYQWLLRVTDYIAGMTDSYAVSKYRSLAGITIGHGRMSMFAAGVR